MPLFELAMHIYSRAIVTVYYVYMFFLSLSIFQQFSALLTI